VLPQASSVDQHAEQRVEDQGPRDIDGFWRQT
jgi:hypothetical protein